ncbi:MAG: hypothetical protein FWD61_03910 [Phycisphaerales bacterium]|nr:hypothetical protein [Phycisphaerales bacterium]
MTSDLFGKPVAPVLTGEQEEFPFPEPSPLDLQVQREAAKWQQARCPETIDMFSDSKPELRSTQP